MGHLVGGISSAGRALPMLDGLPFLSGRSFGAHIWDVERKRYIDTALGFGATLIGHAHPAVVEAATRALANGSMPAFAHAGEEEAAARLSETTGDLSRVIFTNTGSEAVHLACRLARAATGRTLVAKVAAGFDGWYDDVAFGNAGSDDALMLSNTRPLRGRTTLLRFNDRQDIDNLFAENADIAAVLIEPMLANAGCIRPAPGYLEHVYETARRHGALVISDEVLMGFRVAFGLASHAAGLRPDIAVVGKAIGSGLPVAAVLGTPDVMMLCERGEVVRAGTYSGNPVATAAVSATMTILKEVDYPGLLARGDGLRSRIVHAFAEGAGVQLSTSGFGSVFTIWFHAEEPTTYAEAAARARADCTLKLHLEARRRALLLMPQPYGRVYLSTTHDASVLDDMVGIFDDVARIF
ncbi:aminotransferase class III-fold pyridoxal phosphate-dependent enzyme [Mesorhizobium sp. 1B3]|uniref:aminotransferase class III-fold pyridoxal phosphate-dependent enzyme n=1 Tax=Mesorhizobium sp. 1B3 TaxID=3243599 RepID=UPI003D9873B4